MTLTSIHTIGHAMVFNYFCVSSKGMTIKPAIDTPYQRSDRWPISYVKCLSDAMTKVIMFKIMQTQDENGSPFPLSNWKTSVIRSISVLCSPNKLQTDLFNLHVEQMTCTTIPLHYVHTNIMCWHHNLLHHSYGGTDLARHGCSTASFNITWE